MAWNIYQIFVEQKMFAKSKTTEKTQPKQLEQILFLLHANLFATGNVINCEFAQTNYCS